MLRQLAVLLPHLGGKAYSLRSAIVHAIALLLHKALDRWGWGGLASAARAAGWHGRDVASCACAA
jgi:hypothetical protein